MKSYNPRKLGIVKKTLCGIVLGLASLVGCDIHDFTNLIGIEQDIPYPLEADYYLGLEKKFGSFNQAKVAGHVPYTLGIGKRVNEPFDDLTKEEKQYIYNMNKATKRALQELGLEQTDRKETIFYPIRDPLDIIPGFSKEILWIDFRVGNIEPTYPEIGYQGLTHLSHFPRRIYVISKELYPSPDLHGKAFPALPWEISNTFYHDTMQAQQHNNLHSKIMEHYNEIIKVE